MHTDNLTVGYEFQQLSAAEEQDELQRLAKWLDAVSPVQRTAALISREYDQDKYGSVLRENPDSIEEALTLLLNSSGVDDSITRTIAMGPKLYRATFRNAISFHDQLLDETLLRVASDTSAQWFCELGCGFGPHLSRLGTQSYGGELTASGVLLGQKLGLDVTKFNFYDPASYALIRPKTTVFTCAAIEQLPSAQRVLDGLRMQRRHITSVVHCEPTYLRTRQGALGELQNLYIQKNDYNLDLESLLLAQSDIEIMEVRHDVIGVNPLNPASIFAWRFVS